MNKISLRWRITILMGTLVLLASALLTAISIHNATNSFVIPFINSSVDINGNTVEDEKQALDIFQVNDGFSDLLEGTFYASEISMGAENARKSFSVSSCLCMALVTAISMVAAYYLAGRAMRPVFKLNDEIELIDGNTLSKRVSIPQTKDEIENLSLSFNKLLERLEQEFEREKQFSANAAHELKTPLATIMVSAQVLKLNDQTTSEEYRENLDITLQSARRLSDVVEGLFMLCRTDREISFDTVNISQMLHEIQK